jgi:hypothetical protein
MPLKNGIQEKTKLDYPVKPDNDKDEEANIKKDFLWMI